MFSETYIFLKGGFGLPGKGWMYFCEQSKRKAKRVAANKTINSPTEPENHSPKNRIDMVMVI